MGDDAELVVADLKSPFHNISKEKTWFMLWMLKQQQQLMSSHDDFPPLSFYICSRRTRHMLDYVGGET